MAKLNKTTKETLLSVLHFVSVGDRGTEDNGRQRRGSVKVRSSLNNVQNRSFLLLRLPVGVYPIPIHVALEISEAYGHFLLLWSKVQQRSLNPVYREIKVHFVILVITGKFVI